jgi:hypothetical protein
MQGVFQGLLNNASKCLCPKISDSTTTPTYVWISIFISADGVIAALLNDQATTPYHAGTFWVNTLSTPPTLTLQGSIQGRDYSEGLHAASKRRDVSVGMGRLNDLRSKSISTSHEETRFQLLVVWAAKFPDCNRLSTE